MAPRSRLVPFSAVSILLAACPGADDAPGAATAPIETTGSGGEEGSSSGSTDPIDPTTTDGPETGTSSTSDLPTSTGDEPEGSTSSTSAEGSTSAASDPTSGDAPELHAIHVEVAGLDEDLLELTLEGADTLAFTESGSASFEALVADGGAFAVTVSGPADHYECEVIGGVGVVEGADAEVFVECSPRIPALLRISEVGLATYVNDSFWVEVVNVSPEALDLSAFALRVRSAELDGEGGFVGDAGGVVYPLPSRVLSPGDRVLLRGDIGGGYTPSGPWNIALKLDAPVRRPYWPTFGAVELLQADASVDYVAFGASSSFAPEHPSAWPESPAKVVLDGDLGKLRGRSIARDLSATDTNSVDDWTLVDFATPGGPNDTHGCITDGDHDGIPDCAEAPGETFAGVPLYAYGARPQQPDIFVEIDHMDPKGKDGLTVDPGLLPQRPSLDRVVAVFAEHGFALHLDVGDLFDQKAGLDPVDHDLGGGGQVAFADHIHLGELPGNQNLYALKVNHLGQAGRLASFHYCVFADLAATSKPGVIGSAETPGNDFYIALGELGFDLQNAKSANYLRSQQALTFMHELGHNLGLSHGGYRAAEGDAVADEANYKPNYLSVMNYLYSNVGLPSITQSPGDRYYRNAGKTSPACKAKGVTLDTLTGSPTGPLAGLRLDYSNGSGATFFLDQILESKGLGRPGGLWVDYDCDGALDPAPYAHGLFITHSDPKVVVTASKDHDDWGDLDLYFASGKRGHDGAIGEVPARQGVRYPFVRDDQPVALERPLRDELRAEILVLGRR